jgi:hypothetical protein
LHRFEVWLARGAQRRDDECIGATNESNTIVLEVDSFSRRLIRHPGRPSAGRRELDRVFGPRPSVSSVSSAALVSVVSSAALVSVVSSVALVFCVVAIVFLVI